MPDVRVWLARSDPSAAAACTGDERQRAAAFGSEIAARRWLAARGTVRIILGRETGTAPGDIAFVTGPAGKPALPARPDVEFNVSHSGDVVAIAISTRPVGVDIEHERRLTSPARFAERVLDAEAARAWLETPPEQQTRALLQAWTRIEAALKVTGVGIKGGTRGAVPRLASAGGAVRDLDIAPLIGAVAAEGTDWSVRGPEWWPGDQ